jgi:ferrochelatase
MSSTGVLLMTYGSPASVQRADVAAYLARVRGGREPDAELVDEFTRRYRAIGGSPLIEITRRQAAALEAFLGWPVTVGMRFSEPSIADGLRNLRRAGVARVVGLILSPQYSPALMGGYARAIAEASDGGAMFPEGVRVAEAWHTESAFIDALAASVRDAIADAQPGSSHVLMTAHSLPRRVADREPGYLEQIRETAGAVAQRAGLPDDGWTFCWQSAGHEPGEWMKPDFADLMPEIAARGVRDVLVVPVQFLADHLETLYDVDIGARDQAEPWSLRFRRVRALNDDPGLVRALASVARRVGANAVVAEVAASAIG